MTTFNKNALQLLWVNGFIPQGSDYTNLIQSQVNIAETAEQDMSGPLGTTKLITPKVSATNINVTGTVSANTFAINTLSLNSLTVAADVSATTGTVYASATRSTSGFYTTPAIITATGTALSTAAQLTASINRVQGVVDGQSTGVKLLTGRLGYSQYIINETAVSANLWPAGSDYKINALASGAAFSLAANTTYVVVYSQNSAYAVK